MKPLVILAGPTAVGKTALSIKLAKKINGAVISADSMQVYKHMDIGSAKVMPEEMRGIPHYLIDVLEPSEEFNIVRFQQMAKEALQQIYTAGQIPIIAGGTGFYIQSLLYDIDFSKEESDTAYRTELTAFAKEYGAHALHEKLKEYQTGHPCTGILPSESYADFRTQRKRTSENISVSFCIFCTDGRTGKIIPAH